MDKKTQLELPLDDDLDDVLPFEVIDDDDISADTLLIDDDFDDVAYGDAFLSFLDPSDDVPPEYIEARVSQSLEEYTLDELLMENEMEESEVVAILYELGYIGLPEFIADDNEEIQDREEED